MSKEKWNEHRTRSFILAYLNKPSLWDSSCSDYTQKIEVNKSVIILLIKSNFYVNYRKSELMENYKMNLE